MYNMGTVVYITNTINGSTIITVIQSTVIQLNSNTVRTGYTITAAGKCIVCIVCTDCNVQRERNSGEYITLV